MIKIPSEEWIKRFKEIHSDKYDYSKSLILNASTKIEIICPKHGSFWQQPCMHKKGQGCPKCAGVAKLTKNELIKQFRDIHGDKYDYSKIIYKNDSTKIEIICPKHGSFWQKPNDHKNNHGCPGCARNILSTTEVLKIFYEKHGNKYDYSKFIYKGNSFKSVIICPIHGEFLQTFNTHGSQGNICPKCAGLYRTTDDIVKLFRNIHGNKYDYSKVNYTNMNKKIEIICSKHGSFWQKPSDHYKGHGCSKCHESKGERKIRVFFEQHHILYENQKRFKDCKDKNTLPFDFYLPDYNICIEYDGSQHFQEMKLWESDKSNLKIRQKHDQIKTEYCKQNNIKLVRIPYTEYNNIENILKSIL